MKESSTTQSAICSAFTSESIKYTTIKHGSIEIDEARLSIFGAVQAEALVEMLNTGDPDHQGFWDRILLIPAAKVGYIIMKFSLLSLKFRIIQ